MTDITQTDTTQSTTKTEPANERAIARDIDVRWLDAPPERLQTASAFGVPFTRGQVESTGNLTLADETGQILPAQFWPMATWPDGSLKWAGVAVAQPAQGYVVSDAPDPAVVTNDMTVTVSEDADMVRVATGAMTCVLPRRSDVLIESISHGETVVARNVRLVSTLQTTPPEENLTVRRTAFTGRISSVTVEQDGPIRAVVRIEGDHVAPADEEANGERRWLPFTVRFYFTAGSAAIRVVHTVIWNGEADTDFLAGLGLRISVPLHAALHDRHVRMAGEEGGFLAEAVRGLTGLRRDPGADVRAAQVAGRPTPPVETWDPAVSGRLEKIPAWNDMTLSQPTPDGYTLRKRTAAGHGWIGVTAGGRADGFAYLGDITGGVGVGIRNFWQSYPVSMDIRDAATDEGSVTAWLYSPEAEPMDMRFYHDGMAQDDYEGQLDGLEITYEDYEPGFGDANGIARTHELTLYAYPATPAIETLAADARLVVDPPQLSVDPAHLHSAGVFGDWSLPERSNPEKAHLEDQLDALFAFYRDQIDQRRWYGFWNYGDVMHTYDSDRHVWRYDVGGFAWDNSELSPDLWLWYAFLRTGRKDIFRVAEAMTRHTGEVDTYHLGRFKGLGSRHNVQHWGCSAKQVRISNPAYRRFYYYLTTDERTGDLLAELRDSDKNFLGIDPNRKVREDAATYHPDPRALAIGLGTDWGSLAATWLTDWERTGNTWSRDRLLGTMTDLGALEHGFLTGEALYDIETGRFETSRSRIAVSHLSAIFGLVEICSELISLVDIPEFKSAWLEYCRLFLASEEEQVAAVGQPLVGTNLTQAHSRLLAFVAHHSDDADLARRAWRAFDASGEFLARGDFLDADAALHVCTIMPPYVIAPVEEAQRVSTNASAQFGLAAIQNLALVGDVIEERSRR